MFCQEPEIDSSDQDFTSRNLIFWSRISNLKGSRLPIINGTGLYRLILVWRCFIKTVTHRNLGQNSDNSSVYHEMWEVTAVFIAF